MTTLETPLLPELVAITGRKGSGKDYLGSFLAKRGYLHVPASSVLRQIAKEQGYDEPIPREVLSRIGDKLKEEFGPSPIVQSSVEKYRHAHEGHSGLVISGLRRAPEIVAFKALGATVLWVDATETQRFDNIHERNREDEKLEAFRANDQLEYEGPPNANSNSISLKAIEALADVKITNDGSDAFLPLAIQTLRHKTNV